MGKYKKYVKTEQNLEQSNKTSQNNYNANNFNQNNKIANKKREINNKNDLYNQRNRNFNKKDDNSLNIILWEIFDAMKYFFIMCKNFIIPTGISFKIFASFLILEFLYQGIIIYMIKSVLFTLNKYFSIWTNLTNMYIYLISYIQMIYIFICEGLLIFRFIHFKIYLFKKFNWLLNILTCLIILFNASEIKELNSKVYRFHTKNNDAYFYDDKNIENYLVDEYINLYVNKNYDYDYFEFCFEVKFSHSIFEKIKAKISYYKWNYDSNLNLYIGCRNFSFSNNPTLEQRYKKNLILFNCQNKLDVNTAPNFCVSSRFRQKRFYSHIKIAIFEMILLFLWNLYNYFSIELIYHYYPCLKSGNQNNFSKKNNNYKYNYNCYERNSQNNNNNPTVTYKDINDKEIYERDYTEEEEDEYEEEEEENYKKNEDYQKHNYIKEIKMRRISKKKMKTLKKKRKKTRYKEEKLKNKNKYFDDEILSKDFYDNNDNEEESSEQNDNDDDNYFFKINKELDNNSESNDMVEKDEYNDDNNAEDKEEDDDEDIDMHDYIAKKDKIDEFKKFYLQKIRDYQYFQKLIDLVFGKFIRMAKDKIHQICLEVDKNLSDEEE